MSTDLLDTGRGGALDSVLDRPWRIDPRVSVRPEQFGALLYHFGTRRLSFVKDPRLAAVLGSLGEHADARAACLGAGVSEAELGSFSTALATLAGSQMIVERTP